VLCFSDIFFPLAVTTPDKSITDVAVPVYLFTVFNLYSRYVDDDA